MRFPQMENGFLNVNPKAGHRTSYSQAKAVVIPFGMESTVSYGRGTAKGPRAIIKASHQVEMLDEQALKPYLKCGIATLKEFAVPKDAKKAVELLAKIVSQVIADGKYPVVLGGEHSLTQGTVKGLFKHFRNFAVLHFDAHSDTRLSFRGTSYSHGAVMGQVLSKYPIARLIQIGIRSLSDQDGEPAVRKKYQSKIKTFWGWEKIKPAEIVRAIPSKDVFISFDVDAFDPSVMPTTGTPEPGGLLWWQTLEILKAVFKAKNVIGTDVVELAPIKGLHHTDFMVARLVYKLIGYKFF